MERYFRLGTTRSDRKLDVICSVYFSDLLLGSYDEEGEYGGNGTPSSRTFQR